MHVNSRPDLYLYISELFNRNNNSDVAQITFGNNNFIKHKNNEKTCFSNLYTSQRSFDKFPKAFRRTKTTEIEN